MAVATKDAVAVQTIQPEVQDLIQNMKFAKIKASTTLTLHQTTRARKNGLSQILKDFENDCQHTQIKTQVKNVRTSFENLLPDGTTKLYVCNTDDGTIKKNLEFMCVAVRVYMVGNIEACDYVVASYSYAKSIDLVPILGGLAAGSLLGVAGAIKGALAGFRMSAEALSNDDAKKNIILASFLYEIIVNGYGKIENDKLLMLTD